MLKSTTKVLIPVLTIVVVLTGIYLGLYMVCQYFFSKQNIKQLFTSQLSTAIERTVTASDDFDFSIGWDLAPHIVLKDFSIANAAWGSKTPMLKAEEVDLVFNLPALLRSEYAITALQVTKLDLLLQTEGEKQNWEFTKSKQTSDFKITISDFALTDATIVFQEGTAPANILKIDDLQCTLAISTYKFQVNIENFASGESDLHGSLTIRQDPLNIQGIIKSHWFAPRDFIKLSTGDGSYSVPHIALPIAKLRSAEINVGVAIDTIAIDKLPIQNYNSRIFIKDQILNFDLQNPAQIANGTLDVDLDYDLKPATPHLKLAIVTSELDFAILLRSMFGNTPLKGSKFNFKANLQSDGSNLNTLVSKLHGKILATVGPGDFLNVSGAASNLFTSILSGVITFNKQAASTAFTCGVLNLKVQDGIAVANNGLGLEAASVNVLGSGTVDLRNGSINFKITPQNTGGNVFDLAQFSVAQNVTITGTIAQPRLSFNPIGAILTQGAGQLAVGLSGAFGGGIGGVVAGSVISGAVSGSGGSTSTTVSPCKTALESN